MKNPNRFDRRRLRLDHLIQRFFGANALLAIIVLGLITLFLVREGAGFFPQNLQNLRVYRLAGLEYVDLMRSQVDRHTALNRSLQDLRLRQLKALLAQGKELEAANEALAPFDRFSEAFDEAITPLRGIASDLTEVAAATKEKVTERENALEQRRFLERAGKMEEAAKVAVETVDFAAAVAPLRETLPAWRQEAGAFRDTVSKLLAGPSPLAAGSGPEMQALYAKFKTASEQYVGSFHEAERKLERWNPLEPVPWYRAVTSFLFGKTWITNSFWQDVYGVIPLLSGSLLVSGVALSIAVPFGICAAIYVNEIAGSAERNFIKPAIEFIAAIPSVVLGFFGVVVLGEAIRSLTQWDALSWISFFPIAERLNAFTAGCLLAFMAIPTIFTLAEDALNSVPVAFKEASYALGASRLQTVFRIIIPAALSGIISAVLLGFGRVVGETMVVLLCAGNRIAIPDFSHGLGAVFEPVHTMTGIVAQEMGEVVSGSIQYRALFMVGLFLFLLSLVINWLAQVAVRRFKISIG